MVIITCRLLETKTRLSLFGTKTESSEGPLKENKANENREVGDPTTVYAKTYRLMSKRK